MARRSPTTVRGLAALVCLVALGAAFACSRVPGPSHSQASELDRFLAAKGLVFDRQWAGVRDGMEGYLKDFPSGGMRDEALYWLARSLDSLAQRESDAARVIQLERRAIEQIDDLGRAFPRSPWRDDASGLRVQIAAMLVTLGQPQYQAVVLEALGGRGRDAASLAPAKNAALDGVVALAPDVALPALTRVVRTDEDPAVRKKAAVLLAKRLLDRAVPALTEVARSDRDPAVRELARDALERVASALAPVALAYTCLDGRVTDPAAAARLPEGRITVLSAKPGGATAGAGGRRAVERLFANRIALSGNVAEASDTGDPFTSPAMTEILARSTIVKHTMGPFVVGIVPGSVRKTADRITGKAQFGEMTLEFEVGPAADTVLAARRGDRVALMSLRLMPKTATPERMERREAITGPEAARSAASTSKEPSVYCASFRFDDGLIVRSTRCSWSREEANVVDFSRAVAEIPAPVGHWTLTGNIQMVKSLRLLIARAATLVRPDGSRAATADELRVPLGNPAAFTAGKVGGR
jgi:hypothetical protein